MLTFIHTYVLYWDFWIDDISKMDFYVLTYSHFYPTFTENILDYSVLYFLSWNPQKSNSSKIGQSVRIKGLPPAPKLKIGFVDMMLQAK